MSESRGNHNLTFFLAGLGIGAAVALVFAPWSGEEVRKLIAEKADEGKDFLSTRGKQVREQAEDFVEKGKDLLTKGKAHFADAVRAGKQTYHATMGR